MVDGDAVDGYYCVFGWCAERSREIENVFNRWRLGVNVVYGRNRGETIRCEDMNVE